MAPDLSPRRLTILQVNDVHGYLEPHPELYWSPGGPRVVTAGGYARIRTVFEQAREEAEGAVVALDNGDSLHGTHAAVESRGAVLVEPLNLLGLDAMTAHWDFAYGPAHLDQILTRLRHPLLAANVTRSGDGSAAYPSSVVVERGGVRVGVVGLAAFIVDKTMPAHFSEGLRFTLGIEETRAEIRRLRAEERVELVIVLSHLGFPQDCRLAADVEGIDVLLSGHTHNRLAAPFTVGRTLIIQSGAHGSFVGRLDLELAAGEIRHHSHRLISIDEGIAEDAEMARIIDGALAAERADMSQVVGHTESLLHRGTVLQAPMDDLLLSAIARCAQTPLAFSNGWRFGAPIPPGPITRGQLWNIVPPNPPVQTAELTGAELRAMLEENLERTFSADPYRQQGGYVKRCRGLKVLVKIESPPGARIQEIFADGAPIRATGRYRAAFLTTQGVPERYGTDRQTLPEHAIDALEQHLRTGAYAAPAQDGVIAV